MQPKVETLVTRCCQTRIWAVSLDIANFTAETYLILFAKLTNVAVKDPEFSDVFFFLHTSQSFRAFTASGSYRSIFAFYIFVHDHARKCWVRVSEPDPINFERIGFFAGSAIALILALFAIVPVVLAASLFSLIPIFFLPRKFGWGGYFAVTAGTGLILGGFVWFDQTVPKATCSDTSVVVIIQDETYRVPVELRAELKGPWRNNRFAWTHGYRTDNRDEDRRDLRAVCALSQGGNEPINASTIEVQGDWRTFNQIEATCQDRSAQNALCQEYDRELLSNLREFLITTEPQRLGYYIGRLGTSCSGEPPAKLRCIIRIDYETGLSVLARTDLVDGTSQEELKANLNRIIEYFLISMQPEVEG